MNVEHFMTKNPVTCEIDAECAQVAQQMRDKNVGSVIVLNRGRVAGVVTDRQLAITCLADGHDADTSVQHVMTGDPACCTLEDNLFSVLDTFRSAGMVRRVPVVNENNELLGVVSLSDVSVIAKDLMDAILRDETHHALSEAHVMTGGKRAAKKIHRPTKTSRLPPGQPTRVTRRATPRGRPPQRVGLRGPQVLGPRGTTRSSTARTRNRQPSPTADRSGGERTLGDRLRRVISPGRGR